MAQNFEALRSGELPKARLLSSEQIRSIAESLPWDPNGENARSHFRRAALAARMGSSPDVDGIIRANILAIDATYELRREAFHNVLREKFRQFSAHARALENAQPREGFGPSQQQIINRILRRSTNEPEPGNEKSKVESYLTSGGSIHGSFLKQDLADLQGIPAVSGSPQAAFLGKLKELLDGLKASDPTNPNLIRFENELTGGQKMFGTVVLGGLAALCFVVAGSERVSLKGLALVGLLLYIHKKKGTPVGFLTTGEYETLANRIGLRGEHGAALARALCTDQGRKAIDAYNTRRLNLARGTVKPADKGKDPKRQLMGDLGLEAGPTAILGAMTDDDVHALARMLMGVRSPQDVEIVQGYIAQGVQRRDLATVDVSNTPPPGGFPPGILPGMVFGPPAPIQPFMPPAAPSKPAAAVPTPASNAPASPGAKKVAPTSGAPEPPDEPKEQEK